MRRNHQRGQAMVLIALLMTALLGMAALAIDTGLAMSDRRDLQADADTAALAGSAAYPQTNSVHWIAMQYLARDLGFSLPVGSCTSATSCAAGTYTVGTFKVNLQDAATTPASLDVAVTHTQPTVFASVLGLHTVADSASGRAALGGPAITSVNYALGAISGDAGVNGGGTSNPSGTVSGPVYAFGSFGANNGPHAPTIPTVQTDMNGNPCPGSPANKVDLGGGGNSLNYNGPSPPDTGVSPPGNLGPAPTVTGPTFISTASAKDLSGNWKPGIYDGIFPSGGKLNPGIYKIVNVSSTISLGAISNVIPAPDGTSDPTGAVSIVLDSTDTGSLDISQAVLNGIDDLYSSSYTGTRDPQGTHNFVLYGQGYTGGISIGPGSTTDITGVVYLPGTALSSHGNANFQFNGSVIVASMTISGGGDASQTFNWICNFSTVSANSSTTGGLVR